MRKIEIEKYFPIKPEEVDADNLFFSVTLLAKKKGILSEKELEYTDAELHRMITEAAELCGKGYIKEESARVMLKNIFMILDSRFEVTKIPEIIAAIQEKRLFDEWRLGVIESTRALARTQMNFYNVEHFCYGKKEFGSDFGGKLKGDYNFSNIYTHSFDTAVNTKAFFRLSGNESFKTVCEMSEMLCCECAFLEKLTFSDILPIVTERGALREGNRIVFTSTLVNAVVLSMLYAAFYRSPGFFPEKAKALDILDELSESSEEELRDIFKDYIGIAVRRFGIEVVPKEASYGENILNVYASRANEENLELLASALSRFVVKKRKDENGLRFVIHFV